MITVNGILRLECEKSPVCRIRGRSFADGFEHSRDAKKPPLEAARERVRQTTV